MADKIANLKTQTGDNVYPNVIGDNRKNSFSDSSTIRHYFYDKTHKVGFQLANEINTKIRNSLQKPVGLTKTKLVGVGTNGQENIEIGDNLTLANGRLSATGGGSTLGIINITDLNIDKLTGTYTGNIDKTTIKADSSLGSYTMFTSMDNYGYIMLTSETSDGALESIKLELTGGKITGKKYVFVTQDIFTNTIRDLVEGFQLKTYSHFLTLTYSSDNVVLYLTIQNTDETPFTSNTLASYLAGKKVLTNGNLHGEVPTYIAGEGGTIKVYYRTPGDSNINPQPDEFADLSSFAISDLINPVE